MSCTNEVKLLLSFKKLSLEIMQKRVLQKSAVIGLALSFILSGVLNTSFPQRAYAAPGGLNTTISNLSVDAAVRTVAVQADGKMLIGGSFSSVLGATHTRIARLNTDYTIDETFDVGTGANNNVRKILVQADQKILVAGWLSDLNGNPAAGKIVRLNSDGTIDGTFTYNEPVLGNIEDMALQADGKIIIVGSISSVHETARAGIARLNTDGTHDLTFDPGTGLDGTAYAVDIDSFGDIYVGGAFTSFNGNAANRVVRINTDGSYDAGFDSSVGANGQVNDLTVDGSDEVYIAGAFTTYAGAGAFYGARINADGTHDAGFDMSVGFSTTTTVVQIIDSKVYYGGNFLTFNGVSRTRFVKLETNGTEDTAFNTVASTATNTVFDVALTSEDRLVVVGNFTAISGFTRFRVAEILIDEYIVSYSANTGGSIDGTATQFVTSGGNGTAVTADADAPYYEFTAWNDLSTDNPRTDTNVTEDLSFYAEFERIAWDVEYLAGTGGSITGTANQVVAVGGNSTSVTATPDTGYLFSRWDDGVTTAVRQDLDVQDEISVTAVFFRKPSSSGGTPVQPTYDIALETPNGGEVLQPGMLKNITWANNGNTLAQYVTVSLSLDGGSTYSTVAQQIVNNGSYLWLVPNIASSDARIKVEATDLAEILSTDASDSAFSISASSSTNNTPTQAPISGQKGKSPVTGLEEDISVVNVGDYVKSPFFSTVYYIDSNMVRRPFMDATTYFTWQNSFGAVKIVTDATLPTLTIGAPMLPKAGVVLVKIESDPKTYALEHNPANPLSPNLRWITSELIAISLYGADWADYVIDIPPTFFTKFGKGSDVTNVSSITVDRSMMKKRVNLR